jgi:hypothetical protein
MSIQSAWHQSFDFLGTLDVVVEPGAARLTSDAGLLIFRQLDERLGYTRQFAAALSDPRDAAQIDHTFLEMVRSRIYGILADYADQNDHDTLRSDPVFKVLADRPPDGAELASQPTLSRFENAIDIPSLRRLRDVLIDQFIGAFPTPPRHLTFDVDGLDAPTYGDQQLTLFHGFFGQYQYYPLYVTSADNDLVVMAILRHGTASASLAADEQLEYLVTRLRAVWPDVHIHIRADAGFGVPDMYAVCERLGLTYSLGLAANATLKALSADLLAQAVELHAQTGQSQRLFSQGEYQAKSWHRPRRVVFKAEANAQGTNRRFIVTNRPGAVLYPGPCYEEYADRGEGENRNKELKPEMSSDRLSDHRFMANYFRLFLHAEALNLLVRLRGAAALPIEEPPIELPFEALPERERRRLQNRRRRQDPLREGQACTWRTHLIKVAAQVTVSTRRVLVRLSASWPHLHFYRRVAQCVATLPPRPFFSSA